MAAAVAMRQTAGRRVSVQLIQRVIAAVRQRHRRLRQCSLSVAIVGDAQMRRLNRVYHGVDAATDVLTFALAEDGVVEIIICYPQAVRQAAAAGWSVSRELELLIAHGLLHVVGFDDCRPVDEVKMRKEEATVLALLRRVR
jgi:probable rRNA maturation factor